MKKIISILILFFPLCVFGMYSHPAATQKTLSGNGSWSSPYVVNTCDFSWRYDVPEALKNESNRFAAEIHLDGYRNCSTQFFLGPYTWQEIESTIFMFTEFDTGEYYFRLSVLENGKYVEVSSSSRMHVRFQLPPWQEHECGVEYEPLMVNQGTKLDKIIIANQVGGDGSKSNPFTFTGSKIRFMLKFWNDTPRSGAYLWCIERNQNAGGSCLQNPHRYMKSQSKSGVVLSPEQALVGTFGDDAWFNEVQEYDFEGELCITSANYLYKLVIDMYDESGTFSRETFCVRYMPGEFQNVKEVKNVENLHFF